MTRRIALYAGSFDPITLGHLDVIRAGAAICDHLVIAVGVHPGKKPLFSFEKRIDLIARSITEASITLSYATESFSGLVVDAARAAGATILLRGVRDGSDLDDEMRMAGMNGAMHGTLQTILVPATPQSRHINATLVRQIAAMGGNVTGFVTPSVATALADQAASTPSNA